MANSEYRFPGLEPGISGLRSCLERAEITFAMFAARTFRWSSCTLGLRIYIGFLDTILGTGQAQHYDCIAYM